MGKESRAVRCGSLHLRRTFHEGMIYIEKFDGKRTWRRMCFLCSAFARKRVFAFQISSHPLWLCVSHAKVFRRHGATTTTTITTTTTTNSASQVSSKACRFLDQLEDEWGSPIWHRHEHPKVGWIHREAVIPGTKFRVDGIQEEQKRVIEFMGDYWHGNLERFEHSKVNHHCKKTMGELNQQSWRRLREIQSRGYFVYICWEKQFDEWCRQDEKKRPLLSSILTVMDDTDEFCQAESENEVSPCFTSFEE